MAHRGDGLNDIFDNSVDVKKRLTTQEGTILTTPITDSDISNKKYVDDSITALGLPLSHTDAAEITDVGTNTHAQIDTHITDDVIKTAANVQAVAVGGDATGTVGSIQVDHVNIASIGTNTHAQIDTAITNSETHIADNTQAHSDYMLNTGDTAAGNYAYDSVTLVVDSVNHRVGVGIASPLAGLHVNRAFPLIVDGGNYSESDLYFLNTNDTTSGVGYAAKVIGVNIQNAVGAANQVYLRSNTGGLVSAGAIYLGSNNTANQGIFGVLGASGAPGTVLPHLFTIKGDGKVGIGTATPSQTLSVAGVIQGQATALTGDVLLVGNDAKISDIDVANTLGIYSQTTPTEGGLKLGSGGAALYGKSSGIGIGTITPTSTLHIANSTNMPSPPVITSYVPFKITDTALTTGILIDSNQIESVGGTLHINNRVTGGTGMDLALCYGGGNVGIGTANPPQSKLEVVGNIELTGGIDAGNTGVYLKKKVIEIGDWNMDANASVSVEHGLTNSNVREIQVVIRTDDGTVTYPLDRYQASAAGDIDGGVNYIGSISVYLVRRTGGSFDSILFDSTDYNRGWITITYTT